MKNLIVVIAFLMTCSFAFAQANKTYVKTVNPDASQIVKLEFDFPYDVEQWDQENLRLLIDVKLKNGNEKILEQLMLAGRYKITKQKAGESFQLDIPGIKKEVTIRGQKLEEEITLKIMVPRYTLVQSDQDDVSGLASVNIQRGLSPELAAAGVTAKFDPNFYEFDVEMNFEVAEDDGALDPLEGEEEIQISPVKSQSAAGLQSKLEKINTQIDALMKQKANIERQIKSLKN